jgi:integrase
MDRRTVADFPHPVERDELRALWRLAATTGLRRGELLGLRWQDVDLEDGSIAVSQQRVKAQGQVVRGASKTGKGRRRVGLDEATVGALKLHRTTQLEHRLLFGAGYRNEGLVFCRADGPPLDPDGVSQRFDRHVRDSGLPRISLHGLRHTHATLALIAGVHPKVVQERLGHSSIAVTLDTYSHAIPVLQADAAEKVAAVVDGA